MCNSQHRHQLNIYCEFTENEGEHGHRESQDDDDDPELIIIFDVVIV